jgi:uncharacterized protein (DUF2237 family)
MIKAIENNDGLNVRGGALATCSTDPMTGFFRDGCCNTNEQDAGSHTVCIEASAEFLEFSKARGNDLSTPMPDYGFSGIKPGDRWCLCAARWAEAHEAGMAPQVFLAATHKRALEIIPLELLEQFATDAQ